MPTPRQPCLGLHGVDRQAEGMSFVAGVCRGHPDLRLWRELAFGLHLKPRGELPDVGNRAPDARPRGANPNAPFDFGQIRHFSKCNLSVAYYRKAEEMCNRE